MDLGLAMKDPDKMSERELRAEVKTLRAALQNIVDHCSPYAKEDRACSVAGALAREALTETR